MFNPYGNNNYNPYMGYQAGSLVTQQQIQPQPLQQQVLRVSGRNGADAYKMAPDSSALLLDETQPVVWLKTSDSAGYCTLVPYSISPMEEKSPEESMKSLEDRVSAIENMLKSKEERYNEQSNTKNANGKQPKK